MRLWKEWWRWVAPLRGACARQRTFLWMGVVLAAFCVREDLGGVTSLVRVLGLQPWCYDRLLDFFHSPALDVERLARLWTAAVVSLHPGLVRVRGRLVLLADGLKAPKAGKKMPGVKRLHQASESNTKPPFIGGHSCQALALLVQGLKSVVALPLAARIHEGLVFSNRDRRTLLDKLIGLVDALGLPGLCYVVADAYYASRKIVRPLLARGHHLVTRAKHNAVGYRQAPVPEKRGRGKPRLYGEKVRLWSLFDDLGAATTLPSPVYGEAGVLLKVWTQDLLWKPVGRLVRFVALLHPTRGRILLMTTDLALDPLEVIRLYGYRFKIEVAFKSALHVVGAFLYHFWMAAMTPLPRKARDQHLHKKTDAYRNAVRRKLDAYHRFIQVGLIAQGLLVALATTVPALVWASFGSWLRTIRPGLAPSEAVTAVALRHTLPDLLAANAPDPELAIFIRERLDGDRTQARRFAA